jgi:epoxyqueuosine reductase
MVTAETVKARARALGFDVCGVAPAEALPDLARVGEWLVRGYAGDMGYLPRTARLREDVRRILPSARSVIVTGTVYNTAHPYSIENTDPGEALISRYAWGDDYHEVIGARLEALLGWMRVQQGEPFEARACVDTAPVHERGYAQRAGVGWIGKHGCLINPALGSWLFLGEIVCSLPLAPDEPAVDRCGACTLCLEACPTRAIVGPNVLDARRCISYLTIELRRQVPESLRPAVGTHVYGCDICQEVCPWNHCAPPSGDRPWQPRPALDRPRLVDLWRRTDERLASLTRRSAMSRASVTSLRRNLAVALGNSADPAAAAALAPPAHPGPSQAPDADGQAACDAPSLNDPMVQEHIRWARARRGPLSLQP